VDEGETRTSSRTGSREHKHCRDVLKLWFFFPVPSAQSCSFLRWIMLSRVCDLGWMMTCHWCDTGGEKNCQIIIFQWWKAFFKNSLACNNTDVTISWTAICEMGGRWPRLMPGVILLSSVSCTRGMKLTHSSWIQSTSHGNGWNSFSCALTRVLTVTFYCRSLLIGKPKWALDALQFKKNDFWYCWLCLRLETPVT